MKVMFLLSAVACLHPMHAYTHFVYMEKEEHDVALDGHVKVMFLI